jgi:hypothetical protein
VHHPVAHSRTLGTTAWDKTKMPNNWVTTVLGALLSVYNFWGSAPADAKTWIMSGAVVVCGWLAHDPNWVKHLTKQPDAK